MSEDEPLTTLLPPGFRFAGVHAGIKPSGKPDLAMFVSDRRCAAAATYTQNEYRAASILRNERLTPSEDVRAVVINAGNANACTGEQGAADNQSMADQTAEELGIQPDQVLTLSTGLIGQVLPMDGISAAIPSACSQLGSGHQHFESAAHAILTSDNGPKVRSTSFVYQDREYLLTGCAKGAAMIGPNMATMLCVIMTDVAILPDVLQQLLTRAVEQSFNRISVEAHTSTNDAVILLSNGDATPLQDGPGLELFEKHLLDVCTSLARKIPADGEGASHLIEIQVNGAESDREADLIARTIAQSALVKTAIAGNDPNWGRIMSAAGNAPAKIDRANSSLQINEWKLFQNGAPLSFDEPAAKKSIGEHFETRILVSVGLGSGTATHWTSDLTVEYVRFNSEYTT